MSSRLRPVVLIHGFIGSLDEPALRDNLGGHPLLAPALLGYGTNASVNPTTINLPAQAEHVSRAVYERFGTERVHIVGHSVGGVVSALFANQHPEQVASMVSIEGNFTLGDAFWSASVGRMSESEAGAMLDGFRADPAAWLAQSGVTPTPARTETAARWLAMQPASTLRAMGRSVVEITAIPAYQDLLRTVFARVPVHLVSGERSRAAWDVPEWALRQAASNHLIPGVGHMMMLEDTDGFGQLVARIVAR